VNTEYLGHWGGKDVYQPTRKLPTRWPMPRVHKCACCKIRWFRSITNWYDGLCWVCAREEYEGEEEMGL